MTFRTALSHVFHWLTETRRHSWRYMSDEWMAENGQWRRRI